ncbi:MAG: hypothetical protein U0Q03_03165 [Acidimicrobiales bacterium]
MAPARTTSFLLDGVDRDTATGIVRRVLLSGERYFDASESASGLHVVEGSRSLFLLDVELSVELESAPNGTMVTLASHFDSFVSKDVFGTTSGSLAALESAIQAGAATRETVNEPLPGKVHERLRWWHPCAAIALAATAFIPVMVALPIVLSVLAAALVARWVTRRRRSVAKNAGTHSPPT